MSDRHVRVLRAVARHRQRALLEHEGDARDAAPGSASRRRDLAQRASRARAQLAAAEARRR